MVTESLVAPRLAKYFHDYASFHQTRGNQLTHVFGIIMIVISLLGLLGRVCPSSMCLAWSEFFRLDAGTLLIVATLPFYFILDWKITLPYAFVMMGLYFLGRTLPTPVCWILFVGGWILQGIGHYVFEKKSPAFFRNFTHLFIGPLWIFAKFVGYR